MAKNNGLTLADAQENLKQALELAKRFSGFKVKVTLMAMFDEAAEAARNGWDAQAVTTLVNMRQGIRNTLGGVLQELSAALQFPGQRRAVRVHLRSG